METVLKIDNLSVEFDTPQGTLHAVRGVSLSLHLGETLALVGESGCGKSVLCKSVLRLLPRTAHMKADGILLNGTDIARYDAKSVRRLCGRALAMTFQDPLAALNPTLSVGAQIAEAVRIREPKASRGDVQQRVIQLMEQVGIPDPAFRCRLCPNHLSGGMRQRCVLAVALAAEPQVLFADEPTTALDATIQVQILDLLRELPRRHGTACVLVTHDLGAAARAADRIAVMYAGKIVEIGTAEEVLSDPRHPYTWGLLQSLPSFASRGRPLYSIPGMPPLLVDPPPGDAFACRNPYSLQIDYEEAPPMFSVSETHAAASWLLDPRAPKVVPPTARGASGDAPVGTAAPREPGEILLDVRGLCCDFHPHRGKVITALRDVSFQIRRGEVFGLVGESGAGKSTAARCVMNICRPTAGQVFYQGIDTGDPKAFRRNRKLLQSSRQLIFQDSASSLDGRMTVAELIAEPMKIQRRRPKRGSFRQEAAFWLRDVGLDEAYLDKRPSELSGGQRQRVAIARAISMEPALLVADEPIASLDVSIQAQIINLFRHLQAEHGFSILFIAHDLAVVRYLCDRVGVLYDGRLVECASAGTLFENPQHPYTKTLLTAVLTPDLRHGYQETGKERV